MKIVLQKSKTLFTLVLLLTAFSTSKVLAQTEPTEDTTVFYEIQTQSGKVQGRIIREDAREIEMVKADGTTIVIPTYAVQMKTRIRNPKALGPIVHPTRYLYAPSAIPLKQGEGYLNMIYFLVFQAQYGITDNISIGLTSTPILMPTFVNVKMASEIGENLYASFGGQIGKLWYGDEESLGLVFANLTYGNKEANITLNTGYGFYTRSKNQLPIVEVSGLYQTSPKVSLVGELWVLMHQGRQPTFIGGPALRINAIKNGFIDVGVLSAAISFDESEREAYWPIPFVSLGITF
jgi:hypothetical protein